MKDLSLFICTSFKFSYYSARSEYQPLTKSGAKKLVTKSVARLSETAAQVVNTSWLIQQLNSGVERERSITVLDVRGRVLKRGGRVRRGFQPVQYVADDIAFADEHIPTANFVDWRNVDLSQKGRLRDDMIRYGVTPTRPVCIYDWGDMLFASRLWLALVSLGCTDVSILNGGWTFWKTNQGLFESHNHTSSAAQKTTREGTIEKFSSMTDCNEKSPVVSEWKTIGENSDKERLKESVSLSDMRKIVSKLTREHDGILGNEMIKTRPLYNENDKTGEVMILDARSEAQYNGIETRSNRSGHIPGAISIPYRLLLKDDGFGLRPDVELRQVLQQAGVDVICDKTKQAVCYCNGGVASSLLLFCLVRCGATWGSVRNYCGSFNEWGNLMDTPIVTAK